MNGQMDHHDCCHRRRRRIWHHRSYKDVRPRTNEGECVTQRTTAHDLASGRGPVARPRSKTRGVQLAISTSQMTDRSAPIYASLVKGEGDDSFILIWSRCNGD
jgi:hypothetical protein